MQRNLKNERIGVHKRLSAIVFAAVAVGVAGCRLPSESDAYTASLAAFEADTSVPAEARARPIGDARIHLAKNRGAVRLAFDYRDANGAPAVGSYTVWLNRIARTWVVDRGFVTPLYGAAERESGMGAETRGDPS